MRVSVCVYLYAHVLPACVVEVPVCHCAHVGVRMTLVFAATSLGLWFLLVSLWIPGCIAHKLSQTLLVLPFVLQCSAAI